MKAFLYELPASLRTVVGKMSPEQQSLFEEEYQRARKEKILYLILAIFFPIHYFLLGKVGLGVLYILTGGGFFLWWFIDIFRIFGMVRDYNADQARKIIRDMKIMDL